MSVKRDYYEVLEIKRDASQSEIKKSFIPSLFGENTLNGDKQIS